MTRVRRLADILVVLAALVVEFVVWGGQASVIRGITVPRGVVPVLVGVVYSLLLLRWRCPLRVFWLQWAFAALFLLVPHVEPFAGLMIAMHAVAARLSLLRALGALVPTLLMFLTYSYLSVIVANTEGNPIEFTKVGTLWTVLCLLVWGVGRLSYTLARRELRLHDLQLAEALQAERLRLARELHDIVAHSVTVMILQAAGARAVTDPADTRARGALSTIEGAGVQAMAELHRLLGLLRSADPGATEGGGSSPRLGDLPELVERFRAGGQRVTVSSEGVAGSLDPSVELAAFRIVQEALTNAAKHGDGSEAVRVTLTWDPDQLTVRVTSRAGRSDRVRTDGLSSGLGLQGLRERVHLVGGTLVAGLEADRYEVMARLPRTGAAPLDVATDVTLART